jgi:glycosyltransferase involved in cell wall biosynthesis
LVHFPHFNVPIFWFGKYVVTIHDLIKHKSKGIATTTRSPLVYWLKHLLYLFTVWSAVKRAAKVITPSNWWKEELIKRYKLPPEKVVVTYEGAEEKFKVQRAKGKVKEILEKYKIKKPFVIYTGSLYPHKNVERLVEAVKLINQKLRFSNYHTTVRGNYLQLVVVCARNIFYERFTKKIKQMGAEKYVNLVGFVPDEELVRIYQQAEAFVFPSLLEGFGLPGLEAMAVGLPVVASDSSCLPEVYGEAALYFNPLDVEDMATKIQQVISDKGLREKLIKKGFEQVKKYSWEKMAKQTLVVYLQVLARTEVRFNNYR